ncbi:heme peroxidase family protein [uncultured Roseobacter sp.]|uniref:peroxidase family protein n=1 Tax=uncultured Roseobacter sp. TaxID=114847 RepID=UPI00260D2002|nr:heme peroxidase family protein [uncultured Roseobacter sp.]
MAHGSRHFDILAPRSAFYHGPFGRLCPDLDPWHAPGVSDSDAALLDIANNLMIELPGELPADIAADQAKIDQLEADFGSSIPAGYTYFGQFVDHDITFDPASSLMRKNDPNGLINFRTPRLDLDNIYGAGPDDQPYLYDPTDKAKLAIGEIEGRPDLPDLPRFRGRALIGDMRNDENSMVSQLQLAFLLAHNALVDRARAADPGAATGEVFERARKTLRWLYQHIVWNDFIPRIAVDEVYKCALKLEKTCDGRKLWKCQLDDIYSWKHQPFMPVEFSVAAYRFGHSMVRNGYQTNHPERGFGVNVPIFDNTGGGDPDDLRGFRPMKPENCIQWDWFLQMTSSAPGIFPQMARKIDTKLSNALAFLFEGTPGDPGNVLAFRNLKRGVSFDLPSGTSVARKFCVPEISLRPEEPDALWYYILREAQGNGGNTLGRVGSVIVCSVFAGLLKGDPRSWVSLDPCWSPSDDPLLKDGEDNVDDAAWTLASIIRIAGIKADGVGLA